MTWQGCLESTRKVKLPRIVKLTRMTKVTRMAQVDDGRKTDEGGLRCTCEGRMINRDAFVVKTWPGNPEDQKVISSYGD